MAAATTAALIVDRHRCALNLLHFSIRYTPLPRLSLRSQHCSALSILSLSAYLFSCYYDQPPQPDEQASSHELGAQTDGPHRETLSDHIWDHTRDTASCHASDVPLTFLFCLYCSTDKLGRRLGQPGQFGQAVLATHLASGETRAVKIISKARFTRTADKNYHFESLRAEIQVMQRMSHPNIIKLYEVYESATDLYLVMECCSGGELFDRIKEKGSYSEKDASVVMRQMTEGIRYMHSNGIAHCDLKVSRSALHCIPAVIAPCPAAVPVTTVESKPPAHCFLSLCRPLCEPCASSRTTSSFSTLPSMRP